MPKPIKPQIKEAAKAAYLQCKLPKTAAIEKIADEFGVAKRTIWTWYDDGDWDAAKKTQNIIEFIPNNSREPREPRRSRDEGAPIDALKIIEEAIWDLQADLGNALGREKAQTANALKGLLEFHRKLKPPTARELAAIVVDLGISPTEFVAELRAAGWGQSA